MRYCQKCGEVRNEDGTYYGVKRFCDCPPSPCSAVPDEIVAFLLGEGPFDGVWFGEKHPTERGSFWWRKHLRHNAKAQEGEA